jgi:LmbE family N-acetylglucosaminyl deacetylase
MTSIASARHIPPQHPSSPHSGTATRSAGELLDRFGRVPLTVLGVWAHPDDESLLAGGFIAEIIRRGGRVVTVTATAGEHGTDDPSAEPPGALALRRSRELDDALLVLGASPAVHLGYGDGSCSEVAERLAAQLVGGIIDRIRPDLVVTFGVDGVTGHPDHRAVHRWVCTAVADRADRIPVLGTVTEAVWSTDGIERLHSIDAFWPGYPIVSHHADGFGIRLDHGLLERKLAALSCHASQMDRVARALGPAHFVDLAAVECFVAANQAAHDHLSQEVAARAA